MTPVCLLLSVVVTSHRSPPAENEHERPAVPVSGHLSHDHAGHRDGQRRPQRRAVLVQAPRQPAGSARPRQHLHPHLHGHRLPAGGALRHHFAGMVRERKPQCNIDTRWFIQWSTTLLSSSSCSFIYRYIPLNSSLYGETNLPNMENTSVFYLSGFQYIILAVVVTKGYPHKKPLYHNGKSPASKDSDLAISFNSEEIVIVIKVIRL